MSAVRPATALSGKCLCGHDLCQRLAPTERREVVTGGATPHRGERNPWILRFVVPPQRGGGRTLERTRKPPSVGSINPQGYQITYHVRMAVIPPQATPNITDWLGVALALGALAAAVIVLFQTRVAKAAADRSNELSEAANTLAQAASSQSAEALRLQQEDGLVRLLV